MHNKVTHTLETHVRASHRYILHAKKTAFVIEHDFIMATYLADRVIVFEGQPAVAATAMP
jgi:ATP-binding cassette subfamily E protein 1